MGDESEIKLNSVADIAICTQTLTQELNCLTKNNPEERKNLISKHLSIISSNLDFSVDLSTDIKYFDWFNVKRPLDFQELDQYILVLDFFTYCCINCLHILPDLENLEEVFKPNESPVLVIGVHSAKFDNEKLTQCVSDAISRYHITHPVINDINCKLWHELGITCWPTLLILGPGHLPLFVLMGEGHGDILLEFVDAAVHYFNLTSEFKRDCLPLVPSLIATSHSTLYYPGKIEVFSKGLVISDSGNHRIVITDFDGNILMFIGCGKRGYKDGTFDEAQFNNPEGIAIMEPDIIFVADTNNHAIRKVTISLKMVETICGTGSKGEDRIGGQMWKNQALNSPWDVCLAHSLDRNALSDAPNLLLIAMAGSHQIWAVFLSRGSWLKNSFYNEGTVICLAGSGVEESRNTSYPLKAGFAQPSGICYDPNKRMLYIADSESSSIRQFNLCDGAVKRTAGGSLDPSNLFVFGDIDGKGMDARFQHPLGVAVGKKGIFVADSYNHKIKLLLQEGKTIMSKTLLGTGEAGNDFTCPSETKLNEPGGICINESTHDLFIADTNNHCIKIFNYELGSVEKLSLQIPTIGANEDSVDSSSSDMFNGLPCDLSLPLPRENCELFLKCRILLPEGAELTSGAKNFFKIIHSGNGVIAECKEGDLNIPIKLNILMEEVEQTDILLQCNLSICLSSGVCIMKEVIKKVTFFSTDCDAPDLVHLDFELSI